MKADVAQGAQLKISGTPTFFMNGMQLPGLRGEFFDAAIAWELKRVVRAASRPVRRRMPAAIETEGLTKDYLVGFWRPRPYRALDALTLQRRAGRGVRLPRARTAPARARRSSC